MAGITLGTGTVSTPTLAKKKNIASVFTPITAVSTGNNINLSGTSSIAQAGSTSTPVLVASSNSGAAAPVPEMATTITGSGDTVAAQATGVGAVTPTFWANNKNAILIAAAVVAVIIGFIVYRKIAK